MSLELAQTWERMLDRVSRLSATPTVMAALMHALADPSTTATRAAEVIASDPALTSKLLRVANSARYGFAARVATPSRAVALLGFSEVRSLCYALAASALMPGGRDIAGFTLRDFWRHSLATGICGRSLARRAGLADPEEAFVAGLLHDVAKLAFQEYAHAQFAFVISRAAASGQELPPLEQQALGVDHARLGRWLAERWLLPPPIVAAIGRHHGPIPGAAHFEAIAVAHAANFVALAGRFGASGDSAKPTLAPAVSDALRLCPEDLDPLCQQVASELARSEELLQTLSSRPS
jgi:putative nucleotidyltransferase with HDIG domain